MPSSSVRSSGEIIGPLSVSRVTVTGPDLLACEMMVDARFACASTCFDSSSYELARRAVHNAAVNAIIVPTIAPAYANVSRARMLLTALLRASFAYHVTHAAHGVDQLHRLVRVEDRKSTRLNSSHPS